VTNEYGRLGGFWESVVLSVMPMEANWTLMSGGSVSSVEAQARWGSFLELAIWDGGAGCLMLSKAVSIWRVRTPFTRMDRRT
jgi:hypothetical protein